MTILKQSNHRMNYSPQINIRSATLADIPSITAVYQPAVLNGTASFELEPPDEHEMRRRMASILDGGYTYLVAEAESVVQGYAYFGPYRPRPAYRWTVENAIYIAPDMQRQGVGRLLLTELVRRAEEAGFRQMVAVIGDSAQHASIDLHRSMGFCQCGIVLSVGFKHGRWLDQVIMQRALGPGDKMAPSVSAKGYPR